MPATLLITPLRSYWLIIRALDCAVYSTSKPFMEVITIWPPPIEEPMTVCVPPPVMWNTIRTVFSCTSRISSSEKE